MISRIFTHNTQIAATITLLFCSWMTVTLGGCDGHAMTDAEYLERAKQYRDNDDIAASIIELKNAILKNPSNAEARWLLGENYVLWGDGASAEKELRRAQKLDVASEAIILPLARALFLQGKFEPLLEEIVVMDGFTPETKARAYVVRGEAYLALNDIDRATTEMQQALDTAPDSPDAWFGKAYLAIYNNDVETAGQWLKKLLQADPGDVRTIGLAGNLALVTRDYKKAEIDYARALEIQPRHTAYRLGLGIALLRQEEPEAAIKQFDLLLKQVPGNPRVHFQRAVAAYMAKDYTRAAQHANISLEARPDHLHSHLIAGASNYHTAQFELAHTHLRLIVSQAPDYALGRKLLAATELNLGNTEAAAKTLGQMSPDNANDAQLFSMVAAAALSAGDNETSRQLLEKTVTVDGAPDPVMDLVRLGLSNLRSNNRAQGLENLQRAWDMDPTRAAPAVLIAMNHLEAKEYQQTLDVAAKLQVLLPDDPQGYGLAGAAWAGLGDDANSRAAFEKVLELQPGNPSASSNLASAALREGDVEGARAFYQDVLEHHPGELRTLLDLARLEADAGNAERSTTLLHQTMQANPLAPQPRIIIGRQLLLAGNYQGVLDAVEPLRKPLWDSPEVVALLGQAEFMTGNTQEAIRTLGQWAELQPESPEANFRLAGALEHEGQMQQALQKVDLVLRLDPEHVPARFARARLLVGMGKLSRAEAILNKLQLAHPDSASVADMQGRIAMEKNQPNEAVAYYELAFRERKTNFQAIRLAAAQWQAGNLKDGDATLQGWIGQFPEDLLTRFTLADALLIRGDLAAARTAYTGILSMAPNQTRAHNNLAWIDLQENQYKEALAHARRTTELRPGHPEYMDTLGSILLETGQTDEALRLLRSAASRAPENPGIQFHLSRALAQNGQTAEAIQRLQGILSTKQPFAEREDAQALLLSLEDA